MLASETSTQSGWQRQWQAVQDREGNPEVPGQCMEHGSEVDLPGLRIFLQTFPEDNTGSVSLTGTELGQLRLPGAIMI